MVLVGVCMCVCLCVCVCVFVCLCVCVPHGKYFCLFFVSFFVLFLLSATEYHSNADYNSRGGVVVVVIVIIVVVHTFNNGLYLLYLLTLLTLLTFERLDQFVSYLEGSCTMVSCFAACAYVQIGPSKPAQPDYQPKSEQGRIHGYPRPVRVDRSSAGDGD